MIAEKRKLFFSFWVLCPLMAHSIYFDLTMAQSTRKGHRPCRTSTYMLNFTYPMSKRRRLSSMLASWEPWPQKHAQDHSVSVIYHSLLNRSWP